MKKAMRSIIYYEESGELTPDYWHKLMDVCREKEGDMTKYKGGNMTFTMGGVVYDCMTEVAFDDSASKNMDNLGLDLSEELDDLEVNTMKKIVYRLWAVNRKSGDIYEGDVFSGSMDNDVALQAAILDNAEELRELGPSHEVEAWVQALRSYTVVESE